MARFELNVNGHVHPVEGEPGDTLLTVLRHELDLTGSKYGCGEGHCGACTVLVDGQAMRACVARLAAVSGRRIVTIEGLAPPDRLHPVQEAFIEADAFQCGFCTTGMIMATVALLQNKAAPSEDDVRRLLDRNVCRCGTYPRIVRAVQLAARKLDSNSSAGARG